MLYFCNYDTQQVRNLICDYMENDPYLSSGMRTSTTIQYLEDKKLQEYFWPKSTKKKSVQSIFFDNLPSTDFHPILGEGITIAEVLGNKPPMRKPNRGTKFIIGATIEK